jgi:integrase/recombinase XerD
VSRPILYRHENLPSAFTEEQVRRLQDVTRNDPTPLGLRDYAMLLLAQVSGLSALLAEQEQETSSLVRR